MDLIAEFITAGVAFVALLLVMMTLSGNFFRLSLVMTSKQKDD
jgi:hypothetical protein